MGHLTTSIGEFIAGMRYENIPAGGLVAAKNALSDYAAVTILAGAYRSQNSAGREVQRGVRGGHLDHRQTRDARLWRINGSLKA
jgi:hypothetical protein